MNTNEVKPVIKVLTQEQIDRIHGYSVEILATTGIRVDSRRVRKLFAEALGVSHVDKVVRIPGEMVDRALKTAPAAVDIFDRRGNIRFQLGGSRSPQTRFGIGVTNLYYQNPADNAVTPFTRRHMQLASRLGSLLTSYDVISTVGTLQDVPAEFAELCGLLEMTANTFKPLVVLISESKCFDAALDLLEYLYGDLSAKPFVIPYFNPITPLVLNEATADKMFSAIGRGLPFIYSNYGMSGATSPITPASNLALLNAELLAGLVLSQLIKQGTPVILGSLPACFDMRGMAGLYTPYTLLLNLACAEMMAHYELPHCGTSGSGPGWGPDLSAGGTLWMNHLTSCMGKVGLAPFVGGSFDSLVFSPALVVYSDEVIRQARFFNRGFEISEALVALPEIESTGPGGNFLTADLTVALCRETNCSSSIWPNLTLDQWQAKGCPPADKSLRMHTLKLMEALPVPEDHADLIGRGENFIRARMTGCNGLPQRDVKA